MNLFGLELGCRYVSQNQQLVSTSKHNNYSSQENQACTASLIAALTAILRRDKCAGNGSILPRVLSTRRSQSFADGEMSSISNVFNAVAASSADVSTSGIHVRNGRAKPSCIKEATRYPFSVQTSVRATPLLPEETVVSLWNSNHSSAWNSRWKWIVWSKLLNIDIGTLGYGCITVSNKPMSLI